MKHRLIGAFMALILICFAAFPGAAAFADGACADGNHGWDKGAVTQEPGCTADGVKTYTCYHCGETKTESIPALGHSFVGGLCTRCGEPDASFTPEINAGNGARAFQDGVISLRSSAAIKAFQSVEVDGTPIESKYYEVSEKGGTVVMLKTELIKTLEVGQHSMTIVSSVGSATGSFMVDKGHGNVDPYGNPKTGDESLPWLCLFPLSALCLSALLRRKVRA